MNTGGASDAPKSGRRAQYAAVWRSLIRGRSAWRCRPTDLCGESYATGELLLPRRSSVHPRHRFSRLLLEIKSHGRSRSRLFRLICASFGFFIFIFLLLVGLWGYGGVGLIFRYNGLVGCCLDHSVLFSGHFSRRKFWICWPTQ